MRVDSGVEAGSEITPMYDPMVAKLIVWDRTARRPRRACCARSTSTRSAGLTTLIPFHKALLRSEQWRDAETCRDLVEDAKWLKSLAPGAAGRAAPEEEEEEKVERDYTVEVDSRRFNVKVIGPPPAGGGVAAGSNSAARAGAAPRALRRGAAGGAASGSARVTAPGHGPARERRSRARRSRPARSSA